MSWSKLHWCPNCGGLLAKVGYYASKYSIRPYNYLMRRCMACGYEQMFKCDSCFGGKRAR